MKKISLLIINITILIVCVVWFIVLPGFDSGVAGLTAVGVMFTLNIEASNNGRRQNRNTIWITVIGLLITSICVVLYFRKNKTVDHLKEDSRASLSISGAKNDKDTVAGKYHFDFNITGQGVGGIAFGMPIDDVQQFFKRHTNFTFITDEGARGEGTDFDFPIIYVKDRTNTTIFGIRSGDLKIVDGFEVYSEKFKTYNGVHTGMSIAELSALYNHNLILYEDPIIGQEYFAPFDLQGKSSHLCLYTKVGDNNEATILKPGANYGTENNYIVKGNISYFVVSYIKPNVKYSKQ